MTLIVGILCSDGVAMASDSAAMLSTGMAPTIGQQAVKKVLNLSNAILYASTGSVGMSQLVWHTVSTLWKRNPSPLQNAADDGSLMKVLGSEIAKTVGQYLQTGALIRQFGMDGSASLCKSLIAIPVQRIPTLFTFDYGGQPEMATPELPFVAIGSGQAIADPFLAFLKRLLWPKRLPTLAEGRLAAVWTIAHVTLTNPGGVGGDTQLWILPRAPAGQMPVPVEITQAQIQEHLAQIAAAATAMVGAITQQPPEPGAGAQPGPAAAPPPAGPGPAPAAAPGGAAV